jgi:hypothetical protein
MRVIIGYKYLMPEPEHLHTMNQILGQQFLIGSECFFQVIVRFCARHLFYVGIIA